MNADGSGTKRLTSTPEDDGQPDWSPDGERIVFVRGTPTQIFVMDADGTGATSPHGRHGGGDRPGVVARRGVDRLLAARARHDHPRALARAPDGSERHALTTLDGDRPGAAWSPDSQRLVFSANVEGKGLDIYMVGVDGKDVRPVTSGDDSFEPAWSPDGATIAFSEAGAIVSIDVEDGEEQTLTDSANNDSSPTWKPGTEGEEG